MESGNVPPPPPHGENPKSYASGSGLPPGNYDIFIIPPHSAGNGFLYLPSLRPQTNSFIAGVVCTLAVLYAWRVVEPILRGWVNAVSQSGGGGGILVLSLVVGFAGWMYGKTNHGFGMPGSDSGSDHSSPRGGSSPNSPPNGSASAGKGDNRGPNGTFNHGQQHSSSAWEKAREETRRREEERKRAEDSKRRAEDDERKRTEGDRRSRAAAEKEKWEQMRAREKEQREREERERLARERMSTGGTGEAAERDARLRAAQERAEKIRAERAASERAASERAKSERAPPTFGVGERTHLYSTGGGPPAPKSTIGV